MSGAAGITQVHGDEKNPLYATTYGVGEVICDAIRNGCHRFIIGIGGSATNDGGIGMLQALGFGLLDAEGKQVPFGAVGLESLTAITADHVLPELSECTFRIACDVTNPLCGSNGCSAVFGPQKGADAVMIKRMDTSLASYAALCRKTFPNVDAEFPGTGAAGGLGFAFQTFLSASLEPGIQIVLDETRLRDDVKDADLVITGEGRLDGQTVMGKAPIGVAKLSKEYCKPVLAFSGCVTKDASTCNAAGIDAFFPYYAERRFTRRSYGCEKCGRKYDRYGRTGFSAIFASVKRIFAIRFATYLIRLKYKTVFSCFNFYRKNRKHAALSSS